MNAKFHKKVVRFQGKELVLWSIDGLTWSTRKDELELIKSRLENSKVTFEQIRSGSTKKSNSDKKESKASPEDSKAPTKKKETDKKQSEASPKKRPTSAKKVGKAKSSKKKSAA